MTLNVQELIITKILEQTKIVQFRSKVYQHDVAMIVVVETWLNPDVRYSELLDDIIYDIERKERNGRCGGCLLPIRYSVNSRRETYLETVGSVKTMNYKCVNSFKQNYVVGRPLGEDNPRVS